MIELDKNCLYCDRPLYSTARPGRSRNEAKHRDNIKVYCNGVCASRHKSVIARQLLSKECPVCEKVFKPRQYVSGDWESPSNFKDRVTCGNVHCKAETRGKKAGRARKAKLHTSAQDAAINRFLYQGSAA